MNTFAALQGKTIKNVVADTPQVGLDGNCVEIEFTDGTKLRIRTEKDIVLSEI